MLTRISPAPTVFGPVKIGEVKPFCVNPEHNPPNMIVLPNGIYEHTCPGCGQKTQFTVNYNVWC